MEVGLKNAWTCSSRRVSILQVVDEDMEESEASFLDLAQTLISNPVEREHFFQVTHLHMLTIYSQCFNCNCNFNCI